MEIELQDAVDRWRKKGDNLTYPGIGECGDLCCDAAMLADAYVAGLYAKEAEDQKPITIEWLRSKGAHPDGTISLEPCLILIFDKEKGSCELDAYDDASRVFLEKKWYKRSEVLKILSLFLG